MTRALQVLMTAVFVGAMVLYSLAVARAQALAAPAPEAAGASSAEPEDAVDRGVDMGGTSCAYYLEHRRTNPNLDKTALAWGLGFMSGLNSARLLSGLDSRSADNRPAVLASITKTMIAYCQQHPADAYAFGLTWEIYRQRPLVPGSQQRWQQRRGG